MTRKEREVDTRGGRRERIERDGKEGARIVCAFYFLFVVNILK